MHIVRKEEAKPFRNSDACTAFEYRTEGKDINGVVIELHGRYPDSGFALNEECSELAYIVSGSGTVSVGGKEISLSKGDTVHILPGEKFFWEGEMTMFIASAPAWYPEQYKHIQ